MMTGLPLPPTAIPEAPPGLPKAYAFLQLEERTAVAAHSPRVVFIEVTNHCNLLCETCPRTFVTYEEPMTLAWENFLNVVEHFPEMERAVLHGIGEPLLNKDLPRMIAHLKARGVTVLFNTNATLLNEDWARRLIESGLDELRVSIDGANPKTYALIRGAPLLHKLVNNLKRFIEIQSEMRADGPRVSLWMTGVQENIGELPGVIRLAAHMGVPEVYLQRMTYYAGEADAPGMMTAAHSLFGAFDECVEAIVAESEALAQSLGVTLRAAGATTPSHSLKGENALKSIATPHRPWTACMRPWTTAYVTANGNCLPCCISPFATTDYESLKLGNLFEQKFDDLWNDARYQQWRTELLSDHPPKPCRGCGVYWSL
jgi:radical SAM protein with 4Fe4S-binding SPASM domain